MDTVNITFDSDSINSDLQSDIESDADEFNEYDDVDSFPSDLEVCDLKYRYIDLGKGLPKEVLLASVKCQRTERLQKALGGYFEGWLPGDVENWIHSNKLCAVFTSRTEDGIPTDEDMDVFLKNLAKLPSSEQKRVDDDYDDYDAGNEWKYHMSGGDYENNPDTWNSYWDC